MPFTIKLKSNIGPLLLNLALVFGIFTLTRLVFVACNQNLYADHLSAGYLLRLLVAGLRFDCTAILYLNCWMILFFLLPLHWKESMPAYYRVQRWLYVLVNFIGFAANLCDCAYFPFTGRRTTWNVLEEFSNEGNFATIIAHEALPYWYLFPLAALLVWVLWKGFRTPQLVVGNRKSDYVHYYVQQTVLLLLSAGLTVGGIRGGFTTAIRPITMSNANQYVEHAIDAGIVLNTPFCIMRTIGDEAFTEREYLSQHEAENLYSPVHVPREGAEFKPYNVVVMIMESFGQQAMARGYMPFLESLAHKGKSFQYSFATGRKSIDAMPSVLASIPSFVEPFVLTSAALNDLSGLAGELTLHKGYTSAFFHGAENGSMGFQAFAKSVGFQQYFGRTEYNQDARYQGDEDFDGTWAIWDEEFLQFYCDKMTEMKEPFLTSVFTASSHSPFVVPERYKQQFPATNPEVWGCIKYSDNALRLFFEKAEKQPWFQHTIFVITADHTCEAVDPEFTCDLGRYKVPIIIYAPCMPELRGVDTERIISQTDIMPTVLGLLGYDKSYVAFGEDALHQQPEQTFAVNYLPGNGYYQLVQGDWMLQFDGEQVVHAYRYKEDPALTNDLNGAYPKEIENRLKSYIQQYMYRMNHNQLVVK